MKNLTSRLELPNLLLGTSLTILGSYFAATIINNPNQPYQVYIAAATSLILSALPFIPDAKNNPERSNKTLF